jgi:hypothetical protein
MRERVNLEEKNFRQGLLESFAPENLFTTTESAADYSIARGERKASF